MSLLQNEDYTIYQLRTAYLANIHDGVGERLINVNTTFLNDPAFRAAGLQPNAKDIKRTYSPPIPTAGSTQYFKLPAYDAGRATPANGEEEDEGGMVTGQGREELFGGPALIAKRRRRKEQLDEDDDSSDLSDESEDEVEAAHRPANQIRFAKMPTRERAGSSPIRSSSRQDTQPSVLVTSPSRPPDGSRLRHGSLGAADARRTRPRRDTTTSSEMSSENDLDPSLFTRKPISASARNKTALHDRINEDEEGEDEDEATADDAMGQQVDEDESSDSSLISGFSEEEEDDDESLLEQIPQRPDSSSIASSPMAASTKPRIEPTKKAKSDPEFLSDLPPPRPISTVQPISALGQAIRARNKKAASPFEKFATLSGIGEPGPLCIKLFVPSSSDPEEPMEIFLKRPTQRDDTISVAQAIGFGLWRYSEEKLTPVLSGPKLNVNAWMLWMVDDGEVDLDFPPLERLKPITDLTSNNNRARPRMREKPWDEFALVEATPEQMAENERITPQYSEDAREAQEAGSTATNTESTAPTPTQETASQPASDNIIAAEQPTTAHNLQVRESVNPITNPRLITAPFRRDTNPNTALDLPTMPTLQATPRTGPPKTLNIHYTSSALTPQVMQLEITTDTYLSEVFDQVCKRLNLDKALYVLRITGTSLVAPADRTVEALGNERSSLDLARRRFVGEGGVGLSGSPGSSSPNAPITLPGGLSSPTTAVPGAVGVGSTGRKERAKLTRHEREARRREKKRDRAHPLAQATNTSTDLWADTLDQLMPVTSGVNYRRYFVQRKTAMSFSTQHPRILVLDGEYLHIMAGGDIASGIPAHPSHAAELEGGRTPAKTTVIHFSSVVGCKVSRKHRKLFRVDVFKERETKRYDFEAGSHQEAAEIVEEILKGVEPFRSGA